MRVLVIYDTTFGNTELIARGIADGLGETHTVQLARVDEGPPPLDGVGLLVVGGPTQRHGLTPALRTLLQALPSGALRGVPAATFDTRYHMPRLLSGSAARAAARRLRRHGCRLAAAPESFFMKRDLPHEDGSRRHEDEGLEHGEIERARIWGERLAAHLPRGQATVTA